MINSRGDCRGHRSVPEQVLVDLRGSTPCVVVVNRISSCRVVYFHVVGNIHGR